MILYACATHDVWPTRGQCRVNGRLGNCSWIHVFGRWVGITHTTFELIVIAMSSVVHHFCMKSLSYYMQVHYSIFLWFKLMSSTPSIVVLINSAWLSSLPSDLLFFFYLFYYVYYFIVNWSCHFWLGSTVYTSAWFSLMLLSSLRNQDFFKMLTKSTFVSSVKHPLSAFIIHLALKSLFVRSAVPKVLSCNLFFYKSISSYL